MKLRWPARSAMLVGMEVEELSDERHVARVAAASSKRLSDRTNRSASSIGAIRGSRWKGMRKGERASPSKSPGVPRIAS